MKVNIVNNYYKPGAATKSKNYQYRIAAPGIRTTDYCKNDDGSWNAYYPAWHIWGKYYVTGNVNPNYPELSASDANQWNMGIYEQIDASGNDGTFTAVTKDTIRITEPINYVAVTTHSAEQAYEKVLQYAGASLHRDAFDEQMVSDTRNGTATATGDGVYNDSNSGVATLPGKIKFKDLNGDGVITGSDDPNVSDDRTVIGNTNPKYVGGFGLSGQWKNFDFAANFTYMLDFDINNATAYALSSVSGSSKNTQYTNVLTDFKDGWRYTSDTDYENLYKNYYDDGATDAYIAMNTGKSLWNPEDVRNNVTHSYFIEDGSFLRCSDVTLGYTFPTKLIKKIGLSKLRLYLSASNLFIITGYSGFDPEVDIQTGLTPGMDYNRYPRSRSFTFGANINF